MMLHDESHDRHGEIVHRPCSSCISNVEKSNENSIEFSLSNADKGAVGLIPALELASLTPNSRVLEESNVVSCNPVIRIHMKMI